jgi:hypothetical protein
MDLLAFSMETAVTEAVVPAFALFAGNQGIKPSNAQRHHKHPCFFSLRDILNPVLSIDRSSPVMC